jgi:hypothetical protein
MIQKRKYYFIKRNWNYMEAELLRNIDLLFLMDFSFITCVILCIKNTSSAASAFQSSVAKCKWKQCRINKNSFLFHNWKTACDMFNSSSLSWRCTFNCGVYCMYCTLHYEYCRVVFTECHCTMYKDLLTAPSMSVHKKYDIIQAFHVFTVQ